MDPLLSSLFPINQIGSDGFNWWVGQVESNKNADPKNSGRYKVRIVGQHLKDCDATSTEELPWANVMMPVTAPFTDGGVTGATVDLRQGNWVIGFYMDSDKQKPIIMGSIGHTAGATLVKNVEKDPSPGETCKSFTTYFDPNINPYKHLPLPEKEKDGGDATKDESDYTTVGQAGLIANAVPEKQSAAFYGLFAENTTTNPTGGKICVEIANPKCGSESDLRGGLTNILSGMLAANQQSGGQIGTYYVSKINGELTNYIDIGRSYVNKAVRLVKSFLSRVKGEIVQLIRKGVDKLVDLALNTNVIARDDLGNSNTGPVNPDLGIKPFQPITKKISRLKPIIDTINEVLSNLGCSIEDITDRIAQWLTDLLFGFLMDAFNAAACLVDTLVNGVINEILALLEELISSVLGPLQILLAAIANPIDLIGGAINKVLSLLGISCDGPNSQCEKVSLECVDCGTNDTEDWLDKLIKDLEAGPPAGLSVCSDAKTSSNPQPTKITFIGGIFTDANPVDSDSVLSLTKVIDYNCANIIAVEGQDATFNIVRTGNTTMFSSIKYETINGTAVENDDFISSASTGTLGFAPGETSKTITYKTLDDGLDEPTENFFIQLSDIVTPAGMTSLFSNGTKFECEILNYDILSTTPPSVAPPPTVGPPNVPPPTIVVPPTTPTPTPYVAPKSVKTTTITTSTLPVDKKYDVSSDRSFYFEGQTIIYTIVTENVLDNTVLSYTLSGDIIADDISGGQLTGTFTIVNQTATVNITVATNDDILDENDIDERIIFSIDGTNASTTANILGQSNTTPYYSVQADRYVVKESETITYTINTLNIVDGTVLTYTLSGDVTRTDIVGYRLSDSFIVNNNTAVVKIQIAGDGEIENAETLIFTIDNTTATTSVIISSEIDSEDPDELPTFFVESDKLEYSEGETAVFTITTTNVSNGTKLQYFLIGSGITESDIVGGSLSGSFIVIENSAVVYVGINLDLLIESDEAMTFVIDATGASSQVTILSADKEKPEDPPEDVKDPCINPPVAGAPITDERGAIISIPILGVGCPYSEPPKVIITGRGFGSSAIALLDDQGRVSEVRVTRVGRGYIKNTADTAKLACVIDSYTLINPGRGYESEPAVYINGELGVAQAKINEDGYVYSVEVLDRTKTFKEIPSILIQGGGGFGARVLPSLNCLDIVELERTGYAKIGTGKYIDCP